MIWLIAENSQVRSKKLPFYWLLISYSLSQKLIFRLNLYKQTIWMIGLIIYSGSLFEFTIKDWFVVLILKLFFFFKVLSVYRLDRLFTQNSVYDTHVSVNIILILKQLHHAMWSIVNSLGNNMIFQVCTLKQSVSGYEISRIQCVDNVPVTASKSFVTSELNPSK